jgi:hypothetical protein
LIGALKLNNLYSAVQKSDELNNLYVSTSSEHDKKHQSIPQKSVEYGSPADAEIDERSSKVPNNFFHVVEGHPTPSLMKR